MHCDCSATWLFDWLHSHIGLGPVPKCKTPETLTGISLTSADLSGVECDPQNYRQAMEKCTGPLLCPDHCSCNGQIISCEGSEITQIPTQDLPSDVTELRFTRARIPEIHDNAFSKFTKLRSLEISDCHVKSISPSAFSNLINLRSLTLFGNGIEDLPEKVFKDLHNLETLYLNNNALKCLRKGLFSSLTKLRILSLFDNALSSIANGTFDSLNNLNILHL